jgi:glutathione S-transferase
MKLYVFPIAPNPTKVRLYLAEKTAGGAMIDLPQVTVNLREGEQRGPAHLVLRFINNTQVMLPSWDS